VADPARVVLCGGAFSDNIGDAVISDCLAYGVSRLLPHTEIVRMDISGRLAPEDASFGPKGRVQKVLAMLPQTAGRYLILLAGSLYMKRSIEPAWRRVLAPGDAVVIGGGQLFQDEHLNFPVKMWWLGRNLRLRADRAVVYSVGVSANWSALGRRLFRGVLENPKLAYCSVRDRESKRNLLAHLPSLGAENIEVDLDPALLAGSVYRFEQSSEKEFDVGVGVMHPHTLRVDVRQKRATPGPVTDRWKTLIGDLLDRGLRVALFTNGAQEDEEYMEILAAELRGYPSLTVIERPDGAAGFVANIARMRSVMAHRLHASIVAYALGVPSLGLRWDPKVESFYAVCRRDEWVVDFAAMTAGELAERTRRLVDSPVDRATQASVVEQCREGIARLADGLSASG
jgi:polysaccharide pyruvyl transferase WcaK-like protein